VTPPSGASGRGPRRRRSQLAGRPLCLAVIGAALLVAGCAGRAVDSEGADVNQGKTLFVKNCGSCHALQDAATVGTVGPNLDDAFYSARNQAGYDESTFFQITLDQMRLAAPPMPNFDEGPQKLPEQQLEDIAAYVAGVAGKPAQAGGTGTTGSTESTTAP
jgi:mono/diheme cytochrome c family protein